MEPEVLELCLQKIMIKRVLLGSYEIIFRWGGGDNKRESRAVDN